jgi:hypothetical protein
MKTVVLPWTAIQVLGPQHLECTPVSVMRSAARPFTSTSGDPLSAGPMHLCGQQGLR